eukprot:1194691-Prorocentrum_minimum.AAC.2
MPVSSRYTHGVPTCLQVHGKQPLDWLGSTSDDDGVTYRNVSVTHLDIFPNHATMHQKQKGPPVDKKATHHLRRDVKAQVQRRCSRPPGLDTDIIGFRK